MIKITYLPKYYEIENDKIKKKKYIKICKKYLKQLFKQQKNISEVKKRILFFKRFIEICENNTFITNDELEYFKKEFIFIRLNR